MEGQTTVGVLLMHCFALNNYWDVGELSDQEVSMQGGEAYLLPLQDNWNANCFPSQPRYFKQVPIDAHGKKVPIDDPPPQGS